jgi:hypothetical protein
MNCARFAVGAWALALAVVACAPAPAPVAEAGEAPVASVPATVPAPPPAIPEAKQPVIDFNGIAGVAFGSALDAIIAAWPQKLVLGEALEPEPGACRYLTQAQSDGEDSVAFMVIEDRFVRFDVDSTDYAAPGGARIGDTLARLRELYAGRYEEQPHAYTDGLYVIVAPEDGGPNRLVFETDAGGRVTNWRIGQADAVGYVEGCS